MDDSKRFIIKESSGVVQQPKIIKTIGDEKAIFTAIVQTADDYNRNNRLYPKNVLQNGVKRIMPMIKNRMFVGEMDHPSGNDEVRMTTVEYKNASHLIRDLEWRNNELWAEIETLRVKNGFTMYGLVTDKVNIGFSLRGISDGEVYGNGRMTVKDPLYVITWDCVSCPSHEKALIQEIKMEHASFLLESAYNFRKSVVSFENNQYSTDIFEQIIDNSIKHYKNTYRGRKIFI